MATTSAASTFSRRPARPSVTCALPPEHALRARSLHRAAKDRERDRRQQRVVKTGQRRHAELVQPRRVHLAEKERHDPVEQDARERPAGDEEHRQQRGRADDELPQHADRVAEQGERERSAHGTSGYPVPLDSTTSTTCRLEKSTAGRTVMDFSSAPSSERTRETVPIRMFGGYRLGPTPGMRNPAVTTFSSGMTSVSASTSSIRRSSSPSPTRSPGSPEPSSRPATAESGSMINRTTDELGLVRTLGPPRPPLAMTGMSSATPSLEPWSISIVHSKFETL